MELKRTCKGICKQFRVIKPTGKGRYESGQSRCQICDIWLDYRGAHLKDGSDVMIGSTGWYCKCCNYKMRQKPRNKVYKEKLRKERKFPGMSKYHEFMLPILQICKDEQNHTKQELEDIMIVQFELTAQQCQHILRGKETVLSNRIQWALLYLRKANLLVKTGDIFLITKEGKKILEQNPSRIDKVFLLDIPAFRQFYNKSNKKNEHVSQNVASNQIPNNEKRHKTYTSRIDGLVLRSLDIIKKSPKGTYQSDLEKLLDVSDKELEELIPRLMQLDGISKKEIKYDGIILEFVLKYDAAMTNQKLSDIIPTKQSHIEDEKSIEDKTRDGQDVMNLQYFSKLRANMMKKIIKILPKNKNDFDKKMFYDALLHTGITSTEIEIEFGKMEDLIDLAYVLDPPNKMSMIMEFYRIKDFVGDVPTKDDIETYSRLKYVQFEIEFQSWEHLLERLGYDPRCRTERSVKNKNKKHVNITRSATSATELNYGNLAELKECLIKIMDKKTLDMFNILDNELVVMSKKQIKALIKNAQSFES